MIVEKILALPAEVEYSNVVFALELIHDFNELRLCYKISYVLDGSPYEEEIDEHGSWSNPLLFDEPHFCSFLYLIEGIETDDELVAAAAEMHTFLVSRNLIPEL